MRDQTARQPVFPAICARCGGRISEPVAFCPHCGAHARFALAGDASPVRRAATGPTRAEPSMRSYESSDFDGDLDPPWPGPPTPLFASPDGDPYGGEMRAPAFRGSRQWGLKGGTALILGAFVVIYGSAVLLHRYDRTSPPQIPQDSASKSVEGSIAPNGVNGINAGNASGGANVAGPSANRSSASANSGLQAPAPATSTSAPAQGSDRSAPASSAPPARKADDFLPPETSIASLPPPVTQTAPPVAPVQAPPSASPSTGQSSVTDDAAQQNAQQDRPSAADDTYATAPARSRSHARTNDARTASADTTAAARAKAAPPAAQKDAKSGRASVARVLDGVQARLAKNDLRGARASLSSILASDPGNGYAQSLRQQLASREQARDASLNAARACVVQSRWNCVWHNAGSALSVDASSTEAKALVDRAIIESGAATAPAGPGPDTVQVPMVQ